jgi:hypothetical protein
MPNLKPERLKLRTYHVGFGDCFLLSFRYPKNKDRHVLIDFGSTGLPASAGDKRMLNIANDIAEVSDGKLHAVVATNRHKDHISGFATAANGKGSGDIIAGLHPDVVVQPWTEDPSAQPDATKATRISSLSKTFVGALDDMHALAQSVLGEIERRGPVFGAHARGQLGFLSQGNLRNLSAIKNLMTMGKRRAYVYFGSKSGLDDVLPGVRTTVLGPPTLEQTETIRKQRSKDPDEFWHIAAQYWRFQAAAGQDFIATGQSPFARKYHSAQRSANTRWFIPRMDALRGDQLLQILRALDNAMNNTSVILLIEAGDKKLLFPGDAQIENWSYALQQAEKKPSLRKKLESVNLYKVGHHGSLNATPKSLWELFKHKGPGHDNDRLVTVLSTMAGKHGSVPSGTEVPRRKLVEELYRQSDLFTTQALKKGALFHEIEIAIR